MSDKKNKFTITNDKNKEIECEVLFTFESEETKKNYIVYTDNTKDTNNNIKVYASIYDPKDENSALEPIETEKEWEVITNILNSLQEKSEKKEV